ncbi:restriction endonuclease subunit S [Mycoplasma sp. 46852]|uniref:restriction endonuclease subunit S n=1 Tax=Mycoplasma sp. 46852 TaxID=3401683 RepID=UPI003AAB456C
MQKEKLVPAIRFKGFDEEWSKEKIKELTTFRRGSFPQPYGEEKWYSGPGAMPFVQVADVGNALSLNSVTNQLISKIAMPFSVFVPKDSVIVTLQGTIGRVALTNYDCFIDRTILYFNSYRKLLDKTLFAILIKNKFEQEALLAPGAVIKTITKQELNNFELTMPNFNEQQKIGQFFSNLDSLIHSQELKLEKLQTIKQSLLNKMFASYDQKMPEIRFKGFDEEWKQTRLSKVVLKFDNLRVPVAESLRTKGTYPYYGANGIQDYVSGFTHNGEFVLIAEDGANDLDNYPSNYVNGRFWANNHVHVLQGTIGTIDNKFLNYLLKKIDFKPLLTGGDRAKLTAGALDTIYIKISTFLEQRKIGLLLNSIDLLIHSQEQKLEKLNNIKQALLEKMFC